MDHFFERTVPDAIEEQSGPVVRHMLKSRESFDIENTKLRAREAAIIAKFKVGSSLGRGMLPRCHHCRRSALGTRVVRGDLCRCSVLTRQCCVGVRHGGDCSTGVLRGNSTTV